MKAYLDLIQLTKFFLLENSPKLISQGSKESILETPITPTKIAEKPTSLEMKQEIKTNRAPSVEKREDQDPEIASLIKEHFPTFQLRETPLLKESDMIFLTHQETLEEAQLLSKIAQALNKQGFISELVPIQNFKSSPQHKAIIVERNTLKSATHLHAKIKKEEAHFFLEATPLFLIPSLQEFLNTPSSRISWWNQFQSYIK